MKNAEEGATPSKEEIPMDCHPRESDRTFAHEWKWVWNDDKTWATKVRCMRCGEEQDRGK